MYSIPSMMQQQALGFGSKTFGSQTTVHLIPPCERRPRVAAQALPSIRTQVLAPEFTAGVAAAEAPPTVYPVTASVSYASYEDEYRAMVLEQEVSLQHEADRLRNIMQKLQLCNSMQEKVR